MSSLCDDFDDSDDMEDNDDDFGALRSILSWDEADDNENGGAVSRHEATQAITLRDRGNPGSSGMSVPPDMVQFSTNMDGSQQYHFMQANGNSTSCDNTNQVNSSAQNSGSLTLQLPLPTPISGFSHEQDQSDPSQGQSLNSNINQAQQEQQQLAAQNAANFAQMMVQQAGNMFQQQQQQQQVQQQQLRLAIPSMQAFQQQQVQQQQPPAQQLQMQFSTDPNIFLQQLQFAQFQQQLLTAQQQQQHMSNTMQQPVQNQFPQQTIPQVSTIPIIAAQIPATVVSSQTQQPSRKRPKDSDSVRKPMPTKVATKQHPMSQSESSIMLVSASDTDAEAYRSVKSKKSASLAELKKALNEDPPPIDTSNMTEAEKVIANRDRNREHARNTRLRKKAYLEKLKSTVDDLCRERDSLVSERTSSANLLVEMHNTRTEVLMSFFALRTSNEKRRKLWSSILDESSFVCVMPVTPYRSFPASEVQVSKCQRIVVGIDGIMSDTTSLHVLLSTLVDRSKHPYSKINFRYTLISEEAVVAGNHIMARWVMTTTDAVKNGAKMEISKQGMLVCRFNTAHKIVGLEIMFDVMAFMLQLKQATGTDGFSVVPNTVQTCQRSFDRPMVITMAEPPYTIIQVNDLWSHMTGYSSDEVVGKLSCSVLQFPHMNRSSLETLMQEIRYKRAASSVLTNKTKSGETFTNFIVVYPLCTDSRISYYLGLTTHYIKGEPMNVPMQLAEMMNTQSTNNLVTSDKINQQMLAATSSKNNAGLSIADVSQLGLTGLFNNKADQGGHHTITTTSDIV